MSTTYKTDDIVAAVNAALYDYEWHKSVIGSGEPKSLVQNLPGLIAVETQCSKAAFESNPENTEGWGDAYMARLAFLKTVNTVDSDAFSFPRATWYDSQTGQEQDGVMRFYAPSRTHVNCSFMGILAGKVDGDGDSATELAKDTAQNHKWAAALEVYILEYLKK